MSWSQTPPGGPPESTAAGEHALAGHSYPVRMDDITNLRQFEAAARQRLSSAAFGYIAGGSWDEQTLRDNEAAFGRYRLLPRALVDVSSVDLSTTLLGRRVAMPIGFAPVAQQALANPDGELIPAMVAAEAGLLLCLSTFASRSIEDVAAAGPGPRWFQLYVQEERRLSEAAVARAVAAGYEAIVLTVDLAVPGYRERELREVGQFFIERMTPDVFIFNKTEGLRNPANATPANSATCTLEKLPGGDKLNVNVE